MNNRLSKLKTDLKNKTLDGVLVSSLPNITYLTGFSGFSKEEREAYLLITQNKQYIFTDKRYINELQHVILSKAKNLFQFEETSSSLPFSKALEKLIKKHKIKKVGIEESDIKVSEYIALKKVLKNKSTLISYNIRDNRIIKDQTELNAIEKACQLTDQTFNYILTKIKPGITEKELAFEIEFFIKKHGEELAFKPIIAFGKNSAVPHHKPGNNILGPSTRTARSGQKGQIVLFDFGAKIDNYCADMTRVVFMGKANNEQRKVYQAVLEAQKQAIEFINNVILERSDRISSGDSIEASNTPRTLASPKRRLSRMTNNSAQNDIPTKNVDKIAHDYIREQGYGENIFHSLGHGVGLEIHEAPRLSQKSTETLKPGMVFTIEPGIYLPEKFGVRIEDTVVLEEKGIRILTHSPKDIIEL